MDIIDKAKELGNMLKESQQMANLKKAEETLMQDDKGKGFLNDLYMLQQEMSDAMSETTDKSVIEDINNRYSLKQNEVLSYEVTRSYFEAKGNFDKLMKQINDVIMYSLTGQEPCSDDNCSSCGCGCDH
ncbi:YlbF family regulator [Pseudobacteroides cellulosolvens]|uniref:YlbF family regulator n=1 Tax=Pseudobacteroides cellulosolvens ATCC 35603 = DSM 2933 TaxID=398512 RepID=A0A0L6JJA6_9FIRM|nr:YlbF family regulator [Pseudobacteroides cellulosolvens]KNY25763.1 protein of unknown function DUF964 [Pseudobacteroides cellulosolvens ATCC 35603 = DSM 2933]